MTKVTTASTTKTESTQKHQGVRMPTQQELQAVYRQMYQDGVKHHTVKTLKAAPAGAAKAQGFDITEPHRLGASQTAYIIGGQVYVKSTIVSPTAKPTWVKVGP